MGDRFFIPTECARATKIPYMLRAVDHLGLLRAVLGATMPELNLRSFGVATFVDQDFLDTHVDSCSLETFGRRILAFWLSRFGER
jgi:hypothetical protein